MFLYFIWLNSCVSNWCVLCLNNCLINAPYNLDNILIQICYKNWSVFSSHLSISSILTVIIWLSMQRNTLNERKHHGEFKHAFTMLLPQCIGVYNRRSTSLTIHVVHVSCSKVIKSIEKKRWKVAAEITKL